MTRGKVVHRIEPGVNAIERDAGLVRGLGTWGLAASIVSMIIGAGIFAVPSALAAAVGAYAPVAFLACGVAMGAVAVCFAEGAPLRPRDHCHRSTP